MGERAHTPGREQPILFSAPMVRALLDGRTTQTRRVFVPPAPYAPTDDISVEVAVGSIAPNIKVGDRLWVREAHALVPASAYRMSDGVQQAINPSDRYEAAVYRCDWERSAPPWRPSIHMPRWASRLTLTVTDVRVQRLQDISEEDARAEGADLDQALLAGGLKATYRGGFARIWAGIHEPHPNNPTSWGNNPWVAAYTFTVERRNIDAPATAAKTGGA